ncbi:MAG: hypothetical protein GX751_07960 [Desulfuromonadaceae bacterium]|nr:hypothetical protein [Desulfuromonadaceae bacterium]
MHGAHDKTLISPDNRGMAVTPLYTKSELDSLIAALKQAEMALASRTVSEYAVNVGTGNRHFVYRDPEQVRAALQYYQTQRVQLETGPGPQFIPVRVKR